jgi:stage IV sporulation protein FB
MLCVVAGGGLMFAGYKPPIDIVSDSQYIPHLTHWQRGTVHYLNHDVETEPASRVGTATAEKVAAPSITASTPAPAAGLARWQALSAQLFWVNWFMLLLNLLPGFPLDGGRVLQAILWWRSDYRQSMATASYAGFFVMLVIGVYAIVAESVLAVMLALFVYTSCKQQLILLETGGEDSPFGYDFSQGYTSLEGENTPPTPKTRKSKLNFFQRWLQRRAAKRAAQEIEQRESDERRMDELLEKVQREGLPSLTDEERRFLTRVSARYRGNKS